MTNNLLTRLKRKARRILTIGTLGLTALSACEACCSPTDPPVPPVNQSPTSSYVTNPKEGYNPLAVNFNGSSSRDSDGSISKFIWTYGDGSPVDSISGPVVQHIYNTPGTYSTGLIVRDDKGAIGTSLDQVVVKDGSPTINIPDFSFNEDETYSLGLKDKITSPVYSSGNLKITATSPDLEVTLGDSMRVTNKIKDWNGSTYVDITAEDPTGRKTTNRVNATENPQTDVKGYLEDVLAGTRTSGVPILYQNTVRDTSDANGNFDFQVPVSSDTFKINSVQIYNIKIPVSANGQDVNLNNVQTINRYTDPVTGEDLLTFMTNYMHPSRWDDADLPIKVFIDNNPPSPEYREAVRQGIANWDTAVNAWLPEGRKLTLSQIVSLDPEIGIRENYFTGPSGYPEFTFETLFKKGKINMNPIQGTNAVPITQAHEFGHGLGFGHSPHLNHIMYGTAPVLPSPFEGLVVAIKYKLKKDTVERYGK